MFIEYVCNKAIRLCFSLKISAKGYIGFIMTACIQLNHYNRIGLYIGGFNNVPPNLMGINTT